MPYSIPSCIPSLSGILGNDCIGDTYGFINTNFTNIANVVCNLSSTPITVSNTATIQHSLLNRNLTSNVRTNSINDTHLADNAVITNKIAQDTVRYSQLASWQTLSASPTLSAEAVQPRVARAWANFNGSTLQIYDSFNIASVTRYGTGAYYLRFITPLPRGRFAAVGSCSSVSGWNDVNAQTFTFQFDVVYVSAIGNYGATQGGADATDISVICFAL